MTVVRYNPIRNFEVAQQRLNDMMSTFFGDSTDQEVIQRVWLPRVDIVEADQEFKVLADLPGMKRDDVEITIEDGVLTLSGERKSEFTDEKNCCTVNERAYGKFSRKFNLHNSIEVDKIKASFSDGVLTITLPKVETALPRKIEIKAGK